ncbi:MAG: hypothetical protein CVU87_04850 [Firmicutes bacterium HGW-Firmicutes-12]|nr:MAG: hypothetical protein CVU87_04850 [Firmicutes bacterium HGW-Firmicutes-12]
MNKLLIFIWIASTITIAVDELKVLLEASIQQIFPTTAKVKWGILGSTIFAFWAVFSYQTGLLFNIGIQYNNIYFKFFDLTITSLITAGGAAVVYEWIEAIRSSRNTDTANSTRK